MSATPAGRSRSTDAVIILPGIMGSELVDASGDVLWGLADVGWYVSAWTTGAALRRLAVTDEERAGSTGRIRATRLLTAPTGVPVFHGVEPYQRLVAAVQSVAVDPAAVITFPYDWRLPVAHNARELAKVAERHLARWKSHSYWQDHPGPVDDVRLTLVAHSTGGLVARQFLEDAGGGAPVRTLITLGTPFYGSVKAAYTLSTGAGAPLPRRRLQALARTLPGIHDLLPSYRCVLDGAATRRLTAADVTAFGGDGELAGWSLAGAGRRWAAGGPALRPLVGVDQPTMQSLRLEHGEVGPLFFTRDTGGGGPDGDVDHAGDSTVYRKSAGFGDAPPAYVPQSHASLARSDEACAFVRSVLTEGVLGPPLAPKVRLGLDVPDVVTVGAQCTVAVTTPDPAAVAIGLTEVSTGVPLRPPRLRPSGQEHLWHASTRFDRPGLYRVTVKGGGYSAVGQLMLVMPPADLERAD